MKSFLLLLSLGLVSCSQQSNNNSDTSTSPSINNDHINNDQLNVPVEQEPNPDAPGFEGDISTLMQQLLNQILPTAYAQSNSYDCKSSCVPDAPCIKLFALEGHNQWAFVCSAPITWDSTKNSHTYKLTLDPRSLKNKFIKVHAIMSDGTERNYASYLSSVRNQKYSVGLDKETTLLSKVQLQLVDNFLAENPGISSQEVKNQFLTVLRDYSKEDMSDLLGQVFETVSSDENAELYANLFTRDNFKLLSDWIRTDSRGIASNLRAVQNNQAVDDDFAENLRERLPVWVDTFASSSLSSLASSASSINVSSSASSFSFSSSSSLSSNSSIASTSSISSSSSIASSTSSAITLVSSSSSSLGSLNSSSSVAASSLSSSSSVASLSSSSFSSNISSSSSVSVSASSSAFESLVIAPLQLESLPTNLNLNTFLRSFSYPTLARETLVESINYTSGYRYYRIQQGQLATGYEFYGDLAPDILNGVNGWGYNDDMKKKGLKIIVKREPSLGKITGFKYSEPVYLATYKLKKKDSTGIDSFEISARTNKKPYIEAGSSVKIDLEISKFLYSYNYINREEFEVEGHDKYDWWDTPTIPLEYLENNYLPMGIAQPFRRDGQIFLRGHSLPFNRFTIRNGTSKLYSKVDITCNGPISAAVDSTHYTVSGMSFSYHPKTLAKGGRLWADLNFIDGYSITQADLNKGYLLSTCSVAKLDIQFKIKTLLQAPIDIEEANIDGVPVNFFITSFGGKSAVQASRINADLEHMNKSVLSPSGSPYVVFKKGLVTTINTEYFNCTNPMNCLSAMSMHGQAGAVNVFYLNSLGSAQGASMVGATLTDTSLREMPILLISKSAHKDTVVHELGHMIGYKHTYTQSNTEAQRNIYQGCGKNIQYPTRYVATITAAHSDNYMAAVYKAKSDKSFFSGEFESSFAEILSCWSRKNEISRAYNQSAGIGLIHEAFDSISDSQKAHNNFVASDVQTSPLGWARARIHHKNSTHQSKAITVANLPFNDTRAATNFTTYDGAGTKLEKFSDGYYYFHFDSTQNVSKVTYSLRVLSAAFPQGQNMNLSVNYNLQTIPRVQLKKTSDGKSLVAYSSGPLLIKRAKIAFGQPLTDAEVESNTVPSSDFLQASPTLSLAFFDISSRNLAKGTRVFLYVYDEAFGRYKKAGEESILE